MNRRPLLKRLAIAILAFGLSEAHLAMRRQEGGTPTRRIKNRG